MVPLGKSLMICNWSFGEFSNFRNFAIETGNRSRGKFHSLLHRWHYASTVHTVIIFRYLKKASVLGGMKVQGAQTTQFIFVFQNTIAVSRKKSWKVMMKKDAVLLQSLLSFNTTIHFSKRKTYRSGNCIEFYGVLFSSYEQWRCGRYIQIDEQKMHLQGD